LKDTSEIIKINRKIDVARVGEKAYYFSQIQDVTDQYVAIQIPYSQKLPLRLESQTTVVVKVFCEDALYRFTSVVLAAVKDTIPVYFLAYPQEVERVQLRQHVRFPIALQFYYQELEPEPEESPDSSLPDLKKALSIDISGGGMQILAETSLALGSLLHIQLTIPVRGCVQDISVTGRVKRSIQINDNNWQCQAGIAFEDITERDRSKIISFIYKKMVEARNLEPDAGGRS
jgi:c-di-GMP-binding flagellar brake protein YcgR